MSDHVIYHLNWTSFDSEREVLLWFYWADRHNWDFCTSTGGIAIVTWKNLDVSAFSSQSPCSQPPPSQPCQDSLSRCGQARLFPPVPTSLLPCRHVGCEPRRFCWPELLMRFSLCTVLCLVYPPSLLCQTPFPSSKLHLSTLPLESLCSSYFSLPRSQTLVLVSFSFFWYWWFMLSHIYVD